jgi:hypothetical protein
LHVVAVALACAAAPLAAARAGAEKPPLILSTSGEASLELPSGEHISARLPQGASLDAAVALESGWLAAGTQVVPDPNGATSRSRDLLLLLGEGRNATALPVPQGKTGTLRQGPLPLVENGRLAGLAWLEGEDRQSLGVRFAAWNGMTWEAPRTIAPPGPGSQLALTAARLRDGSWLLAWSAYDGHDDEIVWSRGRTGSGTGSDTTWSRPQRVTVDNAAPDITPSLTAAGQGALLAWSRYDAALGEYRVVVSRLRAGRWSAPAAAGPAGSLYPTFEAAADGRPLMLYRTAAPRGWEALELDAAGRVTRRAAVSSAESARPVAAATAAGVAFRWPVAGAERAAPWGTGAERRP